MPLELQQLVEKPKNFKKSLLDVDDLFMSGSDKNSSTGSSSTNSFWLIYQ